MLLSKLIHYGYNPEHCEQIRLTLLGRQMELCLCTGHIPLLLPATENPTEAVKVPKRACSLLYRPQLALGLVYGCTCQNISASWEVFLRNQSEMETTAPITRAIMIIPRQISKDILIVSNYYLIIDEQLYGQLPQLKTWHTLHCADETKAAMLHKITWKLA